MDGSHSNSLFCPRLGSQGVTNFQKGPCGRVLRTSLAWRASAPRHRTGKGPDLRATPALTTQLGAQAQQTTSLGSLGPCWPSSHPKFVSRLFWVRGRQAGGGGGNRCPLPAQPPSFPIFTGDQNKVAGPVGRAHSLPGRSPCLLLKLHQDRDCNKPRSPSDDSNPHPST